MTELTKGRFQECEQVTVRIEAGIAYVALNRPEKRNCLNVAMRLKLGSVFHDLDNDENIIGIILYGEGGHFCAGGDVVEIQKQSNAFEGQILAQIEQNANYYLETCSKPVVAVMDGYCYGAGFDLALSCDFRFVSPNVKIGFPETKLGIFVAGGGVAKLSRYVGRTLTKDLLLTGRTMAAEEAWRLQLVNHICKDAHQYAREFVQKYFINSSSSSIKAYKRMLAAEINGKAHFSVESNELRYCFNHPNKWEGLQAFIDKRKPDFSAKED